MLVKQTLQNFNPQPYVAGFLQTIAKRTNAKVSIIAKPNTIEIAFDTDEPSAMAFSQSLQRYLPHSIFLGEAITTEIKELKPSTPLTLSTLPHLSLCPMCMEELESLSEDYCCTHYQNTPQTASDNQEYHEEHHDGDALLVCNSNALDKLFYLSPKEKSALQSIEKPLLRVSIKDEALRALTGKNILQIGIFDTTKATKKAKEAYAKGLSYLFFTPLHRLEMALVKEEMFITKANSTTPAVTGDLFELMCAELAPSFPILGVFVSIKELSFYLANPDATKKIVTFEPFDATILKTQMETKRAKLLEKSEIAFEGESLFAFLSQILEAPILEKALEFNSNSALKIDMKSDGNTLDYLSLVSSVLSFKLAGTSSAHIAYSVVESYADFVIEATSSIKAKTGAKSMILFGDIAANSVFYSRILSKMTHTKMGVSRIYPIDI